MIDKTKRINDAFSLVEYLGFPVPQWTILDSNSLTEKDQDIIAVFSPRLKFHKIFFNEHWLYSQEDEGHNGAHKATPENVAFHEIGHFLHCRALGYEIYRSLSKQECEDVANQFVTYMIHVHDKGTGNLALLPNDLHGVKSNHD